MLIACVTPLVAQNYTRAQVRQRINYMASHMSSLACDFTQTNKVKMLSSTSVSHGKLYYSKPNKLRMEYTSPYKYSFIMNGRTVEMKSARRSNKINIGQSKVFQEITRIMMGSVLGTCVSNNRDFYVRLAGRGNNWHAVMRPKRNPMKQMFRSITVYFDVRRSIVTSVHLAQKNGDAMTINLSNVKVSN